MYNVLIALIVIAAILLALVVLIQESKGGGLASGFASHNNVMGVRRTTDFIEKTTWGLAIAIAVLSVVSSRLVPTQQNESVVLSAPAPMPAQQNANPAANFPVGQQAPAAEAPAPAEAPAQ